MERRIRLVIKFNMVGVMPVLMLVTGIFLCTQLAAQSDSSRSAIPVFKLIDSTIDRDRDGILDSLDKCPDEKGVVQFDGCPMPDTDNDGLTDDLDSCPAVAGMIKYHGCPPPDTDGDKVNDEEDKCPNQPGVARYEGCMPGDRDGDGVGDDDDQCIDTPGPAGNFGCPKKSMSPKTKDQGGKKPLRKY